MKVELSIKKDPFYKTFINTLSQISDIKEGHKILIGVSGGLDSVALTYLLHSTKKFNLIIAHVNHKLRKECDDDQTFVKDFASNLNIPSHFNILDPLKRKKKMSIEEWGRKERYSFFNDIFIKTDADFIMTAHHGNDQIETLLLNLSRKTGNAGLRGIAHKRKNLLRPLLNFSKKEILNFVKRNKINYINDSSNQDSSFTRNFIRNRVVKPWEKKDIDIVYKVSQSIKLFSQWHLSLDFLINKFVIPEIVKSKDNFKIELSLIVEMPLTLQVRLLEILMGNKNINFSKHHYNMIHQFINKPKIGTVFDIFNMWELRHERKFLVGYKIKDIMNCSSYNLLFNVPIYVNNHIFEVGLENSIKYKKENVLSEEFVDFDKLKDKNLILRLWEKGDKFIPLGMNGHQKVSDFLINQKVEQKNKEKQYVMTADNEIIWICGMRLSDSFKIDEHTKQKACLIQLKSND